MAQIIHGLWVRSTRRDVKMVVVREDSASRPQIVRALVSEPFRCIVVFFMEGPLSKTIGPVPLIGTLAQVDERWHRHGEEESFVGVTPEGDLREVVVAVNYHLDFLTLEP